MSINPSDLLEFLQIESGDSFDVAPDDAVETFQRKGLRTTFSYADMIGSAHTQAFTVAKMMDVDMLKQVRTSLESAMANGTSFREWSNDLMPMLQRSGWWGKQKMIDPATGRETSAQLGSPHRLETIFRTNMQAAYAEQHWRTIEEQKDVAPYLMYDAVDDHRTRPSHRARDNTILPVDSPWWKKNTPPLGYQCRCGVIQLSADEVKALGRKVDKKPPDIGTYQWKNPRTGDTHTLPNGVDPGFDYNVGQKGLQVKLDRVLSDKINGLPPDMQAAAELSLANGKGSPKEAAESAADAFAAAIASKRARADEWVLSNGKRTGVEHVAMLDEATGVEFGKKSGGKSSVTLSEFDAAFKDEKKKIYLTHNHPGGVSLSLSDLLIAQLPGVKTVRAIGHNGSIFTASVTTRAGALEAAYNAAESAIRNVFGPAVNRGDMTIADANLMHHHALNYSLGRSGIISYGAELSDDLQNAHQRNIDLFEKAVKNAEAAIQPFTGKQS